MLRSDSLTYKDQLQFQLKLLTRGKVKALPPKAYILKSVLSNFCRAEVRLS